MYVYKCPEHGEFESKARADSSVCPACGAESARVFLPINHVWHCMAPFAHSE